MPLTPLAQTPIREFRAKVVDQVSLGRQLLMAPRGLIVVAEVEVVVGSSVLMVSLA